MQNLAHPLVLVASETNAKTSALETAIELARNGLVFFPCKTDKTPLVKEWQKLTASETNALSWHSKWPEMMLGLPAGANGLLVIDLDKAKKPGELDGLEEFQALCARHDYDFMSQTLRAQTPSGGLHVFYKMPAGRELRNTAKRLGNAIDTRGHGGYVILAPSKNKHGQYQWLNQNPVADLPDWLLSLLEKPQAASEPQKKAALTGVLYVSERERNAYQAALNSECANVAAALEGIRNAALNVASFNLGRYVGAGKLDASEVCEKLYEAAKTCGLDSGEIGKTVSSGLNSGKKQPKEIKPRGGCWEQKKIGNEPTQGSNQKLSTQGQPEPQATMESYQAEANAGKQLDAFLEAANEFARTSAITTGYENLDRLLDGGLYPGLYVIGAISSLGKTTFFLQMADAIAKAGHDALIFSLEMSRYELMAKTLSRVSVQEKERNSWPEQYAKPARDYLTGKWGIDKIKDDNEARAMLKAFDVYREWAGHVYIIEGCYTLDALAVGEMAKSHIKLTGNKPVVIVDYLQILAPLSDRYTDKQNVDRSIVELKRLSRDLKLPVLTVSSFNRESYATKATMSAFKESGAIEYTSDVLIGLQFLGMSDSKFDVDAAKKANPREIELLLIKNRHGQCGEARFNYYPKFNLFEPAN